ncbi:MAG: hypothetical protein M1827_001662 [Pycnora praestabilis]|nr:MAG: hypothetical protein M1827_001662 [Pycnora praestabilis]
MKASIILQLVMLVSISEAMVQGPRRRSHAEPFTNSTSFASIYSSVPAAAGASAIATATTGLDFGLCTNPGIVFGPGFDSRKDNSFVLANTTFIVFPGPSSTSDIQSDITFNISSVLHTPFPTHGLLNPPFPLTLLSSPHSYTAPQALKDGNVIGHTHVNVQSLDSSLILTSTLDASTFAFFEGINDHGNGKGKLSATIMGGLPKGFYRVCTLGSASNHQPALMPVAQRGAQDDCRKFVVEQVERVEGGSGKGGVEV